MKDFREVTTLSILLHRKAVLTEAATKLVEEIRDCEVAIKAIEDRRRPEPPRSFDPARAGEPVKKTEGT